jgi:hypothetical protein
MEYEIAVFCCRFVRLAIFQEISEDGAGEGDWYIVVVLERAAALYFYVSRFNRVGEVFGYRQPRRGRTHGRLSVFVSDMLVRFNGVIRKLPLLAYGGQS